MKRYGLFGHPLEHSYSRKFFTEKFQREERDDCEYENYDTENIYDLNDWKCQRPQTQARRPDSIR